ncbi:MAG: MaoC/PaaZ C-terminal domain-containing protein [Actinomycetota bacterium]
MAIPTDLAGTTAGPIVHPVDERWIMAYAASIDDLSPRHLDTTTGAGVVAHPVFPVCVEWPAIVAARTAYEDHDVSPAEVRTGVHATHDLTIHRTIRPGDQLSTSLETVGVVGIRPGALVTSRLRTVDRDGRLVASTTQDGIHLGVPARGVDRPDPDPPTAIDGVDRSGDPIEHTIAIDGGRAHLYTECARIWNPIHTDRRVALAAGLPDIILHGTANLAYGVSAVLADTGADPTEVRRIRCRFRAMVLLPSTMTVRVWPASIGTVDGVERQLVPFEVLNQAGDPAVEDGVVVLGPEPTDVQGAGIGDSQ